MSFEQTRPQYSELLRKVDELFSRISQKFPEDILCSKGCHSCCKPGITVNALEAAAIRAGLRDFEKSRMQELLKNEAENPFRGSRCSFLLKDGVCGIYELRPIVCRSHGAPLQFKDEEERIFRDVCPLNFSQKNIGNLSPVDVMNLDTINTLLALLLKSSTMGEDRVELKPSKLYP